MADADGKDKKGCCQKVGDGFSNFAKFLFNKETGQIMGRSGKSWAKIGFFYLIFYGFLAGFFSGMLAVFLSTLNDPANEPGKGGPKLTQYVANQPGLTRLDQGNQLLFTYNQNASSKDFKAYTEMVTNFLNKYNESTNAVCPLVAEEGMKEKDCKFNTSLLGECSNVVNATYGLTEGVPCFFVKINKIYGWVPKSSDGKGFLKLQCTKDDVDVLVYPKEGFQISAFPFRGQKPPFELPVVAVKFNVTKYKEVDCYLVGKGIERSDSYVPHRAYGKIRIKDRK